MAPSALQNLRFRVFGRGAGVPEGSYVEELKHPCASSGPYYNRNVLPANPIPILKCGQVAAPFPLAPRAVDVFLSAGSREVGFGFRVFCLAEN